jgi:hypothetical protein
MSKLKILCLHGHHQNSLHFRQKTGALRKALQSLAEFGKLLDINAIKSLVFIDSPVQEGLSNDDPPVEERQTWFTTTDDNVYKHQMAPDKFNGSFEKSFAFVEEFMESNACYFIVG